MDAKSAAMHRWFDGLDAKFDARTSVWRAELRRVEEVLDARLKHLEEHG